MSRKDDRQRCLALRHNPSLAFASTESLIEAYRLTEQDSKLDGKLRTVDEWLSPEACLTFIRLFALGCRGGNRNAELTTVFLLKSFKEWCHIPERSVRVLGSLLDGVGLDPRPNGATCASTYLAVFMAKLHNPNVYIKEGIAPPDPMLLLAYQAAHEGDEHATAMLQDYWQIMDHYNNIPTMKPLEPGSIKTPWQPPKQLLKTFAEKVVARYHRRVKDSGFKALAAVVDSKKNAIEQAIKDLWQEVIQKARRDLRPDGDDGFHIQGPLDWLGCGYRAFVRNEHTFPTVGMATLAKFQCCVVWLMQELKPDPEFSSGMDIINHLGGLLAYHRLVCQEPTESSPDIPRRPDDVEQIVGLPYSVRPHDRVLPEGRSSSARALEEYQKVYPDREGLPDGKTWVRQHDRHHRPTFKRLRHVPAEAVNPILTVNLVKTINDL